MAGGRPFLRSQLSLRDNVSQLACPPEHIHLLISEPKAGTPSTVMQEAVKNVHRDAA
jgi:hypothetical protein